MRTTLGLGFVLGVLAATLLALPAAAALAAPTTQVISIDFSFTPPRLSAACGFPVTRHITGELTVRTFVDAQGAFTRELDQYHLVETVSANGQTLVARTIQNITTTVLRDGSFTVAFVGTDFLLPVPGAGVAFGSVGRLALHFAADGTLLEVAQEVGSAQQDFAAICQALAPPT